MKNFLYICLVTLFIVLTSACEKNPPEPPSPTTSPSTPATPDASGSAASNDLSGREETKEMPLPGQNSDHSVPEDVAPLKSPPDK